MTEGAIRVMGLGKQYRIGGVRQRYKTLRESLVGAVGGRLRRLHDGRSAAVAEDTIWALRDVSFDVEPGEVVGVIGRNGAGKSTLLKILSRITEPTTGRVLMDGRVASLLEVGTGFHGELTGRENIFLNGAILGMRKAEIDRKFDEIVDFAEVGKFIDTPVKRYSSGMHVRLAFAVAAHLEPEILLVDEVLAVGDVSFQKKSVRKMREVSGAGRTVLFVSHNMLLIRTMCTRCFLLEDGALTALGDPGTVIDSYLASHRGGLLYRKIEERDHAYGVSKVRVEDVAIVGESGEPLREVLYHQPIRVRIHLRVISHIPAGKFSISVLTAEDVRVFISHSLESDEEYHELMPGPYILDVEMANTLKPGDYRIEFGGHQLPSTVSICAVLEALHFHVSEQGYTDRDRVAFCNRSGLVDGSVSWQLSLLPSPETIAATTPVRPAIQEV